MMTSINQIFDLEQGAPTLPRPQPSYTLFPSYMKYHLERFKHVIRNYFSNTTTKEHDEKPHIQSMTGFSYPNLQYIDHDSF